MYDMSSWHIKGGDLFTQVILRFPNGGRSDTEVKYRRAPPSCVARDKHMISKFRQQNNLTHQRSPTAHVQIDENCDVPVDTSQDIHIDTGLSYLVT